MQEADPAELVQLIIWLATQRGDRLTTIRVVKFLYLCDLYFARRSAGRTLTRWPWGFVHYGPYCRQSLQALGEAVNRGLVTPTPYESKYDHEERELYSCDCDEEPLIAETLPLAVVSALKAAVRRWGDNTPGLLDHVYFETEPMIHARPGQRLNFSLAREPQIEARVQMRPLSRSRIKQAKEIVERLTKTYERSVVNQRMSGGQPGEDCFHALRGLEGEPLTQPAAGEANIEVGSVEEDN